jgi:hypothetical protein
VTARPMAQATPWAPRAAATDWAAVAAGLDATGGALTGPRHPAPAAAPVSSA